MCRPFRDSVISEAKSDLNSIHQAVGKFLDADGDTKSNKTDIDISGGEPEDFSEDMWDFSAGTSIDALCKGGAQMDRFNWMKKMEKKVSTTADMFHLLDANGDGTVTKSEMILLYAKLDPESTGTIKPEKITQWIDDNLDSICYKIREEIIQGLKTA